MHLYAKGQYSKQAHFDIPDGLYEEEHGRDGFYGAATHLYRHNPPTGWSRIEGPLKPHALDCNKLTLSQPTAPLADRVAVLYNDDVTVMIDRARQEHDFYFRNADGDELFFIHQGGGVVETDFGTLSYEVGDYIVIPKGTTYRFVPAGEHNFHLICETKGPIGQPERGLLGHTALYDPTILETPEPSPILETDREWEVKIKRQNQLTSYFYPFHPMDVAGWKGDLTVVKLNVRDIRPIMSHRVHLPPSAHSTFVAPNAVFCTFLPRPLETEAGAVRVPFYHRNIDYDEVLFYHAGDFFSRDNIGPGMVTFHPQGFHHGPHPNAFDSSWKKEHTDEIAVMLDTVNPLHLTPEAEACEWKDYWKSWQARPKATSGV